MTKVFWGVVFAVVVGVMVWFSFSNVQPRTIPKIKLSPFETPRVAANSIWLRLQEELKSSPNWLWGLDPSDEFQKEILKTFLHESPGNAPAFSEIWADRELGFDVPEKTRTVSLKATPEKVAEELQKTTSEGKRVLLITVTPYAASFLKGGPAWRMKAQDPKLSFYSLLFSDFPRRRIDEAKMVFPCLLGNADKNGIGDLGCQIQQRARALYRKTQPSGSRVGVMDQISGQDFLFLIAVEP